MNDDWFTKAAEEASKTPAAMARAASNPSRVQAEKDRMKQATKTSQTTMMIAAQAAAMKVAAALGKPTVVTTPSYYPSRSSTATFSSPRHPSEEVGVMPNGKLSYRGNVYEIQRTQESKSSPDAAMSTILAQIREAGSPDLIRREAGVWLTLFTNAVAKIVSETNRQEEE